MLEINLSKFPFFKDKTARELLNRHIQNNPDVMPHGIAVVTGCSFNEATQILFLLFHLYLAEVFLLVYHNDHPTRAIMARKLSEGFPILPVTCPICDRDIELESELAYDLLFKHKKQIVFIFEED